MVAVSPFSVKQHHTAKRKGGEVMSVLETIELLELLIAAVSLGIAITNKTKK